MYICLIGGAINIVLDFILILGIDGLFNGMGVKGAATASIIAQATMFILSIIVLYKKTPFTLSFSFKKNPFFNEMIHIFWNMFIRTLVLNIVFILANRFANKNGDVQLTAYTIGYNIWIFSSFFIDGFSNAGNALAGKYLGAKDRTNLSLLGDKLLRINLSISLFLALFYFISYPVIGSLFNNDPEVNKFFKATFWIIIIAQPFNSIAFTFDGIFKGLGEAVYLRNTLIIGSLFIFTPLLYILDHFDLKLTAVWLSMMGWMIFRGGSLYWKFKKIAKTKL